MPLSIHFTKLMIMIKAIINFFRNLYNKEIDYEFEIEFSIYDLLAGTALILFILWMLMK